MSESHATTVDHSLSLENHLTTVPDNGGWATHEPTGHSRASCTCGQLDTGFIKRPEAVAAAREHAALYLPGVLPGAGPVRPDEEPT